MESPSVPPKLSALVIGRWDYFGHGFNPPPWSPCGFHSSLIRPTLGLLAWNLFSSLFVGPVFFAFYLLVQAEVATRPALFFFLAENESVFCVSPVSIWFFFSPFSFKLNLQCPPLALLDWILPIGPTTTAASTNCWPGRSPSSFFFSNFPILAGFVGSFFLTLPAQLLFSPPSMNPPFVQKVFWAVPLHA